MLRRGYLVDFVFANEPNNLDGALPENVRSFNLGAPRLRYFPLFFAKYLRAESPAAVLAAMWPLTALSILGNLLAGARSRLVVSDHNTLSAQYAPHGRLHRIMLTNSLKSYRIALARIAVSDGVADDVSALSGISRNQFDVIHNPLAFDITGKANSEVGESAWLGWTGPRILTVGRLKSQKNHKMLIHAFKVLLRDTDARLMILGTGQLEAATKSVIASEGLLKKVFMPGHVDNPIPYYQSADLFVLSSDYEGFGNVLVEAMACGLPVVTTDCPFGPREILDDGLYGRLVPVGDDQALANAMLEALRQDHDRELLRARAKDFAVERIAERYLEVLFPDRNNEISK
jgi:glycosyltransferase involved in cell wall biosynthesis